MGKLILIFSDGTGQIGGLSPDQRLSNVYKMYRAMRPWPDSPISPKDQVAFYDPGLGAGEAGGLSFRRLRNTLASAIGTGIDQNVVDCYAAIIGYYEPGDRICLFGFSRGAYTVRSLANVLNLCGVPTRDSDGSPVPRHGPRLRKIASDAVRYVYNHGAGSQRSRYEDEREKKAARFRAKYGSEGVGAGGEAQGNVQPEFIGVYDTVAALGSRWATLLALGGFLILVAATLLVAKLDIWWLTLAVALLPAAAAYWFLVVLSGQVKYFFEDPDRKPSFWNPLDWPDLVRHGHLAWWTGRHYDKYVDREIPHLRHALAIDEARKSFARVPWGRSEDVVWNSERGRSDWIRQVWFAGNHSDIGGSYPEEESRLSDIALRWMLDELKEAVPQIQIREELIVTSPDPLGLQHDERQAVLDRQPSFVKRVTGNWLTWPKKIRSVPETAVLHPTVLRRLQADAVPEMGEVKPYRPENLRAHPAPAVYFSDVSTEAEQPAQRRWSVRPAPELKG